MRVTHTASNDDGAAAVPSKSAASKTSTGTAGGADAALIVVDVQNSFIPGGSLAVPNGDEIVPLIAALSILKSKEPVDLCDTTSKRSFGLNRRQLGPIPCENYCGTSISTPLQAGT